MASAQPLNVILCAREHLYNASTHERPFVFQSYWGWEQCSKSSLSFQRNDENIQNFLPAHMGRANMRSLHCQMSSN